MNICRVRGCRYSSTHTTRHHRCGNCGELGHGVVECGNQTRIEYLKQYFHETLPTHKHCSGHHDNVSDGLFHSDECHICVRCGERHLESDCVIQTVHELGDRFREYWDDLDLEDLIVNARSHQRDQIYKKYVGMGCFLYFKITTNCRYTDDIYTFFMHSDSWGQYGEETSDVPRLDRFIGNCQINYEDNNFVNNSVHGEGDQLLNPVVDDGGDVAVGLDNGDISNPEKVCPLCRTINGTRDIKKIYGSNDSCSICYDNKVDYFFSECGHACICETCFQHL